MNLKSSKHSWVRRQASAGADVEGKKRTLSAEGWGSVTEGFMKAVMFEEGHEGRVRFWEVEEGKRTSILGGATSNSCGKVGTYLEGIL